MFDAAQLPVQIVQGDLVPQCYRLRPLRLLTRHFVSLFLYRLLMFVVF